MHPSHALARQMNPPPVQLGVADAGRVGHQQSVGESSQRVLDALVIGGGPAGAAAAFRLAQAGHKVLLCERERFPRFHIGESLLPVNIPLLREMGVEPGMRAFGAVTKFGARIEDASGRHGTRIAFGEADAPIARSTFQVERAEFDRTLLAAAARAGAEVREGCEVSGVERDADGWTVHAKNDGEVFSIRTRWLVDASGRDTFLASRRGEKEMLHAHRRVSLFAHYEGVARDAGEPGGDTILVRMADGWFWLIPIDQRRTSVGVVLEADALRSAGKSAEEALDAALERAPAMQRRMARARRVSQTFATSDFSYRVRRRSLPRAVSIGDAAGFLDPIFSTGVWLAMNGGDRAGRLVDRCLRRPALAAPYRARHDLGAALLYRHFERLIDYFYQPGFTDIFLQPVDRFDLRRAVGTYVSGALPHRFLPRLRLEIVLLLSRWQERLRFVPRIELPNTLAD